jgi:Tetratricopeptide repeat
VAFEVEPETERVQEESTEVRTRRAMVLSGVALVWAAFMVALGLLLPAGVILVVALLAAAWLLGFHVPRPAVRPTARRLRAASSTVATRARTGGGAAAARARVGGGAAARVLAAGSRRVAHAGSNAAKAGGRGATAGSRSAATHLGRAARRAAAEASGAVSTTKQRLERPKPPPPAVRRAQNSVQLRRAGLIDEAVEAAEEALALSKQDGDPQSHALAANSLGIALAKAGRPAEAIDAFDEALALLADTGDRHHEGQVLVNLGAVHRSVGGAEAARFCWSRALERLEPGTPESERTAELLGVR